MAWAEVYFRTKWHLHPSSRFDTIDMGQFGGGWVCPFFLGVAGSPSNTKSPGPRPTSIPSGILVHPAVWPQRTLAENLGLCPLGEGELGPHRIQCRLWSRPTSVPSGIMIQAEKWCAPPFLGTGAGSPSNTKTTGLRPTSIPSGILIHAAVRLQ